jgi:hypothetical protein
LKRALLATFAVLLLASQLPAQVMSLFYQEVEKDGRIYVFNTPEGLAQWKATGEMGKSITLIGRGPNGETVVAENETALDLYLFKHGLPAYERPTPKPPTIPFDLSWKDGKTTVKTKNAQLVLSNRLQVRWTETDPEGAPSKGSFRIRRFKTKLEGWAYSKNLTYELQVNWPDPQPLEDANIAYDFTGTKLLTLKAGQFKVPFGRQELTSSGSQEFVDRSMVSAEFAKARDIGLELGSQLAGGKLEARFGIFNGAGRNATANDNNRYQLDARLTWQPWGDAKYVEGDPEGSTQPLLALAVQYEANDRRGATAGNDIKRKTQGADFVFKYKGLFLFGEHFSADDTPETGRPYTREGFNLQAGYFVIPQTLELALRYAQLDPSDLVRHDTRKEKGVALGYFFNKHAHKLQADFRRLSDKATGKDTDEIRVQYQLIF